MRPGRSLAAGSRGALDWRSRGQEHSSYASVSRAFRVLDRVSRGGQGLDAKSLARSLEISLSTCYQLLSILVQEGYLEKLPRHTGYRLGPTIALLYERSRHTSVEMVVGPILQELAQRSGCPAYFGLLTENDDVVVAEVEVPPGTPPLGVPRGLRAPSHALALGKVQIAAGGVKSIDRYIERHSLEAITPLTITDPAVLEAHLKETRVRGFATESEEFAKGLYSVAAPVLGEAGGVDGAIGLASAGEQLPRELKRFVKLVREAAERAEPLLHS